MFVTLRRWGYVWYITTLMCLLYCDTIMFITLQHYYVHQYAMKRQCSSHCDNMGMFVTLWRRGYVRHIAIIWVCLSHCDGKAMFNTLWHYYEFQIVTLLCSSYCNITMFIALRWKDYVCSIVKIWVCSSHHNDEAMIVTLWWKAYVWHIATLLCLLDCHATMFTIFHHYYVHYFVTERLCLSDCDSMGMFITCDNRLCSSH
jgi:hypothetical protein